MGNRKYHVLLENRDYIYESDKPYVEALRQIIQANYQYAYDKHSEGFNNTKVDNYQCVKIAKKVLCDHGFIIKISWADM
jgi:hypothetical protein